MPIPNTTDRWISLGTDPFSSILSGATELQQHAEDASHER